MNPVVTAATIGVGGTVIVGVAGFGASILNTRQTIAHARESRVWDRRADSYVETLAALHFRQVRREYDIRTAPLAEGTDQAARAYLANYTPPDFHELEARLAAFASQRVFAAVQASSTAHNRAIGAYRSWQAAGSDTASAAIAALASARKQAERADDEVVELIRAELQGRGVPLPDWQSPLAEQVAQALPAPEV